MKAKSGRIDMKPEVRYYEKEAGLKVLEDLKSSCLATDFDYSKVTDIDNNEVRVPAIMLKESMGNKEKYIGKAVTSSWRALNILGTMESHLFLFIQFEGIGEIRFNIPLNEPKTASWISKVIELGVIVICDKEGNFDIGLTNIPIDLPVAQLYVQNLIRHKKQQVD